MSKKKPTTLLVFVQDETGSMEVRAEATVSAYNEYFDTLQKTGADLGNVTVHVWQFSEAAGEDRVRRLHDGKLADVPRLNGTYRPRGITPLLDAVGTAIRQAEAVKADRYLFVVQTDGQENASKDFTRQQVADLVAEKEKADNWTIVFLGAGVNEWSREAAQMGATLDSAVSYGASPVATSQAYSSLATHSAAYLASASVADKSLGLKVQADVSKPKRRRPA